MIFAHSYYYAEGEVCESFCIEKRQLPQPKPDAVLSSKPTQLNRGRSFASGCQ